MTITDMLNAEHGVFLAQLRQIESMLDAGADHGAVSAAAATLGVAVERHREVEERVLYPALLSAMGEGFPPVARMEAEHREIETALHLLRSGEFEMGAAHELIAVLRDHIAKEVEVLFPIAERHIPRDRLSEMGAGALRDALAAADA